MADMTSNLEIGQSVCYRHFHFNDFLLFNVNVSVIGSTHLSHEVCVVITLV